MHHLIRYVDRPSQSATGGAKLIHDVAVGQGAIFDMYMLFYKTGNILMTEAEILADVHRIRVLINGKAKWDIRPEDYNDLCLKMYTQSLSDTGGCLPFHFIPEHLEVPKAGETLQFGTKGLGTIQVEIELKQTITNIVYTELHSYRASYDVPTGVIRCFRTFEGVTINQTLRDIVTKDFAGRANIAALAAFHVYKNLGEIERMGLKVNGSDVISSTPYAVLKAHQMRRKKRVLHADWYSCGLLVRDLMEDQLSVGGMSVSAAGNADVFNVPVIRDLDALTNWKTKPDSDTTRFVTETYETV